MFNREQSQLACKKKPNINWNYLLILCCFQGLSCSSVLHFRAEPGFSLHFHDVVPFVQLNIKLLIISWWRGLLHAILISSEKNYLVSLGAQAVNTEESVYILCQMLFICFEFLLFFFFFFLFFTTQTGPSGWSPLQEPYRWKKQGGAILGCQVRPWRTDSPPTHTHTHVHTLSENLIKNVRNIYFSTTKDEKQDMDHWCSWTDPPKQYCVVKIGGLERRQSTLE